MRILIATVTAGNGHLQAARAIEEAWRTAYPTDEVQCVDVLDFGSKLYRKFYSQGYVKVIEHVPELYAMVFKQTDQPERLKKINAFRQTFARRTNDGFVRFLKKFRPDLVLAPHFLPLEILGHLKQKKYASAPMSVCIVTDFEAHSLWMEESVDLYCVAAEETMGSLIARGVPADKVVVTGIPIASKFSQQIQPGVVKKALGLRLDLPVLLVLSGGFGLGPVAKILDQLDKIEEPLQILVVAGRNQELRQTLAARHAKHPAQVLGFVENMNELMAVSDLIITKPGGLTSSEALALGKPLFIVNPIPGQEAANSDFLLERGAASKINRMEDLSFRVLQLLGSSKLSEMARAAKKLSRPDAARLICQEARSRCELWLGKKRGDPLAASL